MDESLQKTNSPSRMAGDFYLGWIWKISAAFQVTLSETTQAIYLECLQKLSFDQITVGAQRTIEEWDRPSMMPPPQFILARAYCETTEKESYTPNRRFESVGDIDQEHCPKGWSPEEVFNAHLTQERIRAESRKPLPPIVRVRRDFSEDSDVPEELRSAAYRSGVTKEEISQWMEEGKAKGRAIRATLALNPKWCADQARFGVPEYKHLAVTINKSHVPEDPDERRRWATDKAVNNGWITSDPGDEA